MQRAQYYSENWHEATDKFVKSSPGFSDIEWEKSESSKYDIPYVQIGNGPHKIIINSGIHGVEGYFGSAALIMFLREFAPKLSQKILNKYTVLLIHGINGWGMDNFMRETMDPDTGGLVDLNRNFGINFSRGLPENELYNQVHDLLVSPPHVRRGRPTKLQQLLEFYKEHQSDGVWKSIMLGQYDEPFGISYGGRSVMNENKMTMNIHDRVMKDAKSMISIGLHTGIGSFDRQTGVATSELRVSHPHSHATFKKFEEIFWGWMSVVPNERRGRRPALRGNLVDALESRYARRKIPVYAANFEIGVNEFPVLSTVTKRMYMGDARYELLNHGRISSKTRANIIECWYPSDPIWRKSALDNAETLFMRLISYMELN